MVLCRGLPFTRHSSGPRVQRIDAPNRCVMMRDTRLSQKGSFGVTRVTHEFFPSTICFRASPQGPLLKAFHGLRCSPPRRSQMYSASAKSLTPERCRQCPDRVPYLVPSRTSSLLPCRGLRRIRRTLRISESEGEYRLGMQETSRNSGLGGLASVCESTVLSVLQRAFNRPARGAISIRHCSTPVLLRLVFIDRVKRRM